MKKFSEFNKRNIRKIYEQNETTNNQQEQPIANLPEGTESQNKPNSEIGGVSKFFSKLFESREMAHVYHLQVKGEEGSYAAHMALGSYYDGILEFIDDLIEIYQGQYDVIEGYDIIDTSTTKSKDKIEYFKELADFIKTERKCISDDDTHLHNIIDEVLALIYKTLYKLRFNK